MLFACIVSLACTLIAERMRYKSRVREYRAKRFALQMLKLFFIYELPVVDPRIKRAEERYAMAIHEAFIFERVRDVWLAVTLLVAIFIN